MDNRIFNIIAPYDRDAAAVERVNGLISLSRIEGRFEVGPGVWSEWEPATGLAEIRLKPQEPQ